MKTLNIIKLYLIKRRTASIGLIGAIITMTSPYYLVIFGIQFEDIDKIIAVVFAMTIYFFSDYFGSWEQDKIAEENENDFFEKLKKETNIIIDTIKNQFTTHI